MDRKYRLALLGTLTLLVAIAGTVAAIRAPQAADPPAPLADDGDEAPDPEAITHALDRLAENEVTVDEAVFADLAARYGVGGAVRIAAWADETGRSVDEIAAMRTGDGETPMGWGRVARELGVHPGIGSIMGNGRGQGEPPGQERNSGD
jgi:hypothetical protein